MSGSLERLCNARINPQQIEKALKGFLKNDERVLNIFLERITKVGQTGRDYYFEETSTFKEDTQLKKRIITRVYTLGFAKGSDEVALEKDDELYTQETSTFEAPIKEESKKGDCFQFLRDLISKVMDFFRWLFTCQWKKA